MQKTKQTGIIQQAKQLLSQASLYSIQDKLAAGMMQAHGVVQVTQVTQGQPLPMQIQ